jgi:hypothetical protein
MAELYVPGLDLATGLAVDAGEREKWEWREKGHNGDGTLVCLECYLEDVRPGELARQVQISQPVEPSPAADPEAVAAVFHLQRAMAA